MTSLSTFVRETTIKPKRFLVFAGAEYYPCGGWGDLKGSADTLKDAEAAAREIGGDWAEIIDLETGVSFSID